jgi:HNH endonuclease
MVWMKRAIFRLHNIDQMVQHELFVTPIQPATLAFTPGEPMLVATPKSEAPAGIGEYLLLFTVGDYLINRADAGAELFGQPGWRHAYSIAGTTELEPFSLDDVVALAGHRAGEVWERYRGQTQHHRIIRPILPEDEDLYAALIRSRSSTWSATATMRRNRESAAREAASELSSKEIVRQLRRMDRQNSKLPSGKQYRPGRSQTRNARFVELLKALYENRCQVCGRRIEGPDGRSRADVHHLEPRHGDASDRLSNVIVVCPNAHARFELGGLRWSGSALEEWSPSGWVPRSLAIDRHLLVPVHAQS